MVIEVVGVNHLLIVVSESFSGLIIILADAFIVLVHLLHLLSLPMSLLQLAIPTRRMVRARANSTKCPSNTVNNC